MAPEAEPRAGRYRPARSAGHRSRRRGSRDDPWPDRARRVQLTRVWRLTQRRTAAFDGEGARLFGGRWNHRGTPVVYTSSTLPLAVLELLVHLDDDDLAKDYVGIPAEIPDSVKITLVRIPDLPRAWRHLPRPQALADLGTRWAAARESAVLAVPSAIIPSDLNYLLNPLHPQFRRIRIGRPEPFTFDPRLRKP